MITIGIVGYGYVGKAVYDYLSTHYNVIYYDPFLEGSCSKEEINRCKYAFVCVNTPSLKSGKCDTSIVEEVIDWIESPYICIKSTVEPGTTDYLIQKTNKKIVFSPEYLGESTYHTGPYDFNKDMNKHSYFIFGGDKECTDEFINLCIKISGPSKRYIQTDAKSAEVAKYTENFWLATKVIFSNEMDQICKSLNVNWSEVRELWLNDPRVTRSHTAVFRDNKTPFGGKCLPKDTEALLHVSNNNGYSADFLKSVINSNIRIGKRNSLNEQFL
jgi:UDPglucose 6-dehydrogenase